MRAMIGTFVACAILGGVAYNVLPMDSQGRLDRLVENIENLVNNANDIVGDKDNKDNIKSALANLALASLEARQAAEAFHRLATTGTSTVRIADAKLEEVATTVVATSEEIRKLAAAGGSTLQSLEQKAENVAATIVYDSEHLCRAMESVQSILEKVDNGHGIASKLINDGSMCEELCESTEQIGIMLEEMRSAIAALENKKIEVKLF